MSKYSDFLYWISVFLVTCIIISISLSSVALVKTNTNVVIASRTNATDIEVENLYTTNLYTQNIFTVNLQVDINITDVNATSIHAMNIYTTNSYVSNAYITTLVINNNDAEVTITYDGTTNSSYILLDVEDGAIFVMTEGGQTIDGSKVFYNETQFDGGILFTDDTYGTPINLNVSDRADFFVNWNVGPSNNITFLRIGNTITLTILTTIGISVESESGASNLNPFPNIYLPKTDLIFSVIIIYNTLLYTGTLYLYKDSPHMSILTDDGNFPPPGIEYGIYGTAISYQGTLT